MADSRIEVIKDEVFYIVETLDGHSSAKNITQTLKLLTNKQCFSIKEIQKIYRCIDHDRVYKVYEKIYFTNNMYKILYSACEKSNLLKF